MHLRCAAPQQVDERRVEGHDGVAHVHHLLFVVAAARPVSDTTVKAVAVKRDLNFGSLVVAYPSELTPCTEPGRSSAGVSEILRASFMAASRPFPPSPRSAGPKHSGRRMSSLTTTLEFSSTLSPEAQRPCVHLALPVALNEPSVGDEMFSKVRTVDKDGEAQEGEVALPFDGVPADIGVAFSQEHGAALETAARQVSDHLQGDKDS